MRTFPNSVDGRSGGMLRSGVFSVGGVCPMAGARVRSAFVFPIFVTLWAFFAPVQFVVAQTSKAEPTEPAPAGGSDAGSVPVADKTEPLPRIVVLEGQITDAIGRGKSGAQVVMRRKSEAAQPGELLATTTTDEFGDFKVTMPEPVHGEVTVTVSLAEYADLVRDFRVGEDEYPPYFAGTLEGVLVITGHVRDAATAGGVSGATVAFRSFYRDWSATTDVAGAFTIKGLSPGPGDLIVDAEGFGREQQEVEVRKELEPFDILVKPERILHLKVVDDLSQPVPGVVIEAVIEDRADFRTTASDADGTATLRGLPFDTGLVVARLTHAEHVSSPVFDREIDVPSAETESTHELVMQRAGRVTGTVTEGGTGAVVYGARLITGTAYSDDSPRDWSDYEGKYTITGVPPGSVTITVHMSGYAPTLQTIDVNAGKETVADIRLEKATKVVGVVKDDKGAPVPGAHVEATKWRGSGTLGLRTMTGDDGRFLIENAPFDEFEVVVMSPSGCRVRKTIAAQRDAAVEIVLAGGNEAAGMAGLNAGDAAPEVSMTALSGETFELAKLKGKIVLLDFWATWCGPCVAEIPGLIAIHDEFSSHSEFVMIGVSLDWEEKTVSRFVSKQNMAWPQVVGESGNAQATADAFGVVGIPATFIIGPDGKIIAADLRGAELHKRIAQVLKDRNSS